MLPRSLCLFAALLLSSYGLLDVVTAHRQLQAANVCRTSQAAKDDCADQHRVCVDLPSGPGYECGGCMDGWALDQTLSTCIDKDECLKAADNNCDEQHKWCINMPEGTGFECGDCMQEYGWIATGNGCVMSCGEGREVVDNKCINIDECARGTDNCDRYGRATCTDTDGGYTCQCNSPWVYGDGTFCEELAVCNEGYEVQDNECYDIDECANGSDSCDAISQCMNTDGSYTCVCPEATRDGHGTYNGDGRTCSVECSTGYKPTVEGLACEDIDECTEGTANCAAPTSVCHNSDGSFSCEPGLVCPSGYQPAADGLSCEDIDECTAGTYTCPKPGDPETSHTDCQNLSGGYDCDCFPARATVEVLGRGTVAMEDLRIGDQVLAIDWHSHQAVYRPVYFMGKADPFTRIPYTTLRTSSGAAMQLSSKHFMHVCMANCDAASAAAGTKPRMEPRFAHDVHVGDAVYVMPRPLAPYNTSATDTSAVNFLGTNPTLEQVVEIWEEVERGLYAPLLRAADIVVDGIAASVFAEEPSIRAGLTDHLPPSYLITVYEVLSTPYYVLYTILGKALMPAVNGLYLTTPNEGCRQHAAMGAHYATFAVFFPAVLIGLALAAQGAFRAVTAVTALAGCSGSSSSRKKAPLTKLRNSKAHPKAE